MSRQRLFVIGLIFLLSMFVCSAKILHSQAITTEGSVASDAGGVPVYTSFFTDQKGVLIVAPSRANDTGVLTVDITVVAVCLDNRTFRLQIWDSDMQTFVNPENELGVRQKQRRFTFTPSADAQYTIFMARLTNEDATIIYAEITLVFYFNPNADIYKPINDTSRYIDLAEHEKQIRELRIRNLVSGGINAAFGVLGLFAYIRRRY